MTDISKSNATKLGLDTMLLQTQEECAELIQAISKYNRTRGIGQPTDMPSRMALVNLLAEMADVSICVEQISYLLGVGDRFEAVKDMALERVAKRLENMGIV